MRQRDWLLRGNHKPRHPILHQKRRARAEFGGDTGQARGHRLEKHQSIGFGAGVGGQAENIGRGVQAGQIFGRDIADKAHPLPKAESGRLRLPLRPFGAIAANNQFTVGQVGQGGDERIHPFVIPVPPHEEDAHPLPLCPKRGGVEEGRGVYAERHGRAFAGQWL